ncbi:hypothetical protein ACHAWT_000222 [Skeletonema menzelii]|eukprot:scaffold304_cov80-Skeletonema_menzelii.AAC.17
MKLHLFLLLPIVTAFAPEASLVNTHRHPSVARGGDVALKNELDTAAEKIISTTEEYVGKADDVVLNRVMRVVDHAPAFVTLKALADAGGMDVLGTFILWNPSTWKCNADAFAGLSTALSVPNAFYNIWGAICAFQALSLAKSALASDSNELSQADITATTAANWVATRAIGSANPLRDTILTAIVSGYAVRNGSAGGDATLHSASLQLMSSFTTVLAVLGLVNAVAAKIPFVADNVGVINIVGILASYAMVTRDGNGKVKKGVNAFLIPWMLLNALKEGVSFSLTLGSLLTNAGLVGLGYVAVESVTRFKNAVFA